MVELLEPQNRENILEIGSGSGWQTALLSYLVGQAGSVWAYEIKHKVAEFGKRNLERAKRFAPTGPSLQNVDYVCGDAKAHWKKHAPYNRIISGAAFGDEAEMRHLASLLTKNGRLVVPTMANDIQLVERKGENKFKEKIYPGFVFVPVVH